MKRSVAPTRLARPAHRLPSDSAGGRAADCAHCSGPPERPTSVVGFERQHTQHACPSSSSWSSHRCRVRACASAPRRACNACTSPGSHAQSFTNTCQQMTARHALLISTPANIIGREPDAAVAAALALLAQHAETLGMPRGGCSGCQRVRVALQPRRISFFAVQHLDRGNWINGSRADKAARLQIAGLCSMFRRARDHANPDGWRSGHNSADNPPAVRRHRCVTADRRLRVATSTRTSPPVNLPPLVGASRRRCPGHARRRRR